MDKDKLLFEMYKNVKVDKNKLKKLTPNYRELYIEIINYQVINYGGQIGDFNETTEDFNEKARKARNREHSARKGRVRDIWSKRGTI